MRNNNELYVWQLVVNAYEKDQLEQTRAELKDVLTVLKQNLRFNDILTMPTMDLKRKKVLVEETFSGQISNLLIDFLVMLVEKEAFNQLEAIANLYNQTVRKYLEELADMIEGEIYSAIPLSDDQLTQLSAVFSRKTGKRVKFIPIVDESLIGGYRVKIKNEVYDDTIALQLQQLRASLKNTH